MAPGTRFGSPFSPLHEIHGEGADYWRALWADAGLHIPIWEVPHAASDTAALWMQGDPPAWPVLEPGWIGAIPAGQPRRTPRASRTFAKLLAVACVLAILVAVWAFRRAQRWSTRDIAKYLERTGTPWGRREDLFLEKLVLELRMHRAAVLTSQLAVDRRFFELDQVERPLRKMRARFRSVSREYKRIATRIGPVKETVRDRCVRAIRRSGLVQAPTLSKHEVDSMRRLAADVERQKSEYRESV